MEGRGIPAKNGEERGGASLPPAPAAGAVQSLTAGGFLHPLRAATEMLPQVPLGSSPEDSPRNGEVWPGGEAG